MASTTKSSSKANGNPVSALEKQLAELEQRLAKARARDLTEANRDLAGARKLVVRAEAALAKAERKHETMNERLNQRPSRDAKQRASDAKKEVSAAGRLLSQAHRDAAAAHKRVAKLEKDADRAERKRVTTATKVQSSNAMRRVATPTTTGKRTAAPADKVTKSEPKGTKRKNDKQPSKRPGRKAAPSMGEIAAAARPDEVKSQKTPVEQARARKPKIAAGRTQPEKMTPAPKGKRSTKEAVSNLKKVGAKSTAKRNPRKVAAEQQASALDQPSAPESAAGKPRLHPDEVPATTPANAAAPADDARALERAPLETPEFPGLQPAPDGEAPDDAGQAPAPAGNPSDVTGQAAPTEPATSPRQTRSLFDPTDE